jgi:hypothetical protein
VKFAFRGTRGQLLLTFFSMALGAGFAAQGVATLRFFVGAADADAGMRTAGIAMSLCLAGVGLWFVVQGWRRLTGVGAELSIGPDGIRDRRLARRTIPWSDIRNPQVRAAEPAGASLVFDLADGGAARAGITARARRAAAINQQMGFDYRARSADLSVEELTAAVTPYVALEPAD